MHRLLYALVLSLPTAACATLPSAAPSVPLSLTSTRHPSEVRDCVVMQAARSGVSGGDYDWGLDGGFRYSASSDRAVLAEVTEAADGTSRIALGGPGDGRLHEIVRGCI